MSTTQPTGLGPKAPIDPTELPEPTSPAGRSRSSVRRIGAIATYVVLGLGAVTMLAPLVWMVSTSLKNAGAVFVMPPEFVPQKHLRAEVRGEERELYVGPDGAEYALLAEHDRAQMLVAPLSNPAEDRLVPRNLLEPKKQVDIQWRNYIDAWQAIKLDEFYLIDIWIGDKPIRAFQVENAFVMFYLNSIFVAAVVTLGQLTTCSLAAYAFARLEFPGREQLFIGYLATMMVPGVVTLIPVFILLRELGLVDTYWALFLPVLFSAYGTFLLRQFFMGIPRELEDAARMDGCGKLGVLRHVILPLSKPALATLATFTFIASWNDFMGPLIFINSTAKKTLPIGLASFQGLYGTEWTLLMAASVIVLLPVFLVFVFNQRFFTEGIQLSGLGGR
ncbi:MAG: ABC transporter permease subunit [Armatimonadia bacterium]|nr:ABC transporter permease subunit [Armatimonadia bacterium]